MIFVTIGYFLLIFHKRFIDLNWSFVRDKKTHSGSNDGGGGGENLQIYFLIHPLATLYQSDSTI